jgi:hypothetical protein
MSGLAPLLAIAGHRHGASSLWLSPQEPARESLTTLSLAPVVNGKFAEVNYTWDDEDKPQAGLIMQKKPEYGLAFGTLAACGGVLHYRL